MAIRHLAAYALPLALLMACDRPSTNLMPADHCDNGNLCKVVVDLKPGTTDCTNQDNIRVTPDPVIMGQVPNRRILWMLKEPGWKFCTARNDRVDFTTNTMGQFNNGGATDNPNGNPPGPGVPEQCFKNYRWDNKNEPLTYGKDFEYKIHFTYQRTPNDPIVPCQKDPFVRNGG